MSLAGEEEDEFFFHKLGHFKLKREGKEAKFKKVR